MLRQLLHRISAFFTLNKGEQRGVIVLIVLILIISLFNLFLPQLINQNKQLNAEVFKEEVEQFILDQQSIEDSMRIETLQNKGELNAELAQLKLTPFPFNPNNLPEEAWLRIGLSEKQIRTIKNYEAKGGKFKKKEDLKKIYSISEAEYEILAPYINIPSGFKSSATLIEKKPSRKSKRFLTTEMNSADSAQLVNSLHLSPWVAQRTIKYRKLLNGFSNAWQLTEVYGVDTNDFFKIKKYITVDTSLITKLNINKADFKKILRHPYISYDITKNIVNFRSKEGPFTHVHQLVEDGILSESLYIKLKPYLSVM